MLDGLETAVVGAGHAGDPAGDGRRRLAHPAAPSGRRPPADTCRDEPRLGQRPPAGNPARRALRRAALRCRDRGLGAGADLPSSGGGQRRGPRPGRDRRRRGRSLCWPSAASASPSWAIELALAVGHDPRSRSRWCSTVSVTAARRVATRSTSCGSRSSPPTSSGGGSIALQTTFIAVAYAGGAVRDRSRPCRRQPLADDGRPRVRLRGDRLHALGAKQAARHRSRPDGADRPAHRRGEPPRLRGALRGGDRRGASATARRSRCCSATSTAEGDQRPLGPPRRRQGARPGRPGAAGASCAPGDTGRPHRWRRVRRAAARAGRRRGPGRRRPGSARPCGSPRASRRASLG